MVGASGDTGEIDKELPSVTKCGNYHDVMSLLHYMQFYKPRFGSLMKVTTKSGFY